ncbi:unnamed protein product [Adineta steineri]|uniref:G-protein coupled receptors family 1 profile domain-containing protein n=1 Tax=Adineta steineri TaxID=433720 RepID=A0A813Q4L6_9BILA|nr:unnamed protein product [Adineta steineri]CAF4100901.1 unnamed protein product [Adineta steineri]
MILIINILFIIIAKTIIQFIHITIPTLKRDFEQIYEYQETLFCRFRAYILWLLIGCEYWGYTLFVFFRFTRVFYSTHLYLHGLSFYLYKLIPSQYILLFISTLPTLFLNNYHLLSPHEVYCDVKLKPWYNSTYISSIVFGIPYTIMCIFYIFIVWKMRQPTVHRQVIQHHRRDVAVLRRVLFNTVILATVTFPTTILMVLYGTNDYYEELTNRITWLSSSCASILFSGMLPLITAQFQLISKQNKVVTTIN